MNKKIMKICYVWTCLIILLAKESYGYLDPSAMTYVIQIIAAIGITVTTSIGILFYKIKKIFKKKKEQSLNSEDEN